MKRQPSLFVCLLVSLVTVGCQGALIPATHEPQLNQSSPGANSTTDAAKDSTTLTTPQKVDIEPINSTTSSPMSVDQKLITIDDDLLDEVPTDADLTGVIVVGTVASDPTSIQDIYLIDANNEEVISELPPVLPQYTSINGFSVSPNLKLASYYLSEENRKNLFIVNQKGEVLLNLPVINSENKYLLGDLIEGEYLWFGITRWLDNESLVTEKWPWGNQEWSPVSLIYFKPFLATAEEFSPVYPDILLENNKNNSWTNGGLSIMAFDPSLTRLLYLANHSKVVLWDLEKNEVISELERYLANNRDGGPVWAKDGSKFFLFLGDVDAAEHSTSTDLYEVSRAGDIHRLTYLDTLIDDYKLFNLSLSPDENQMAFLVYSDQTSCGENHNAPYLGVYEFDSPDTVKLYCYETLRFFVPIWSPDSRYLLLQTEGLNNYSLSPMLLIDTEEDYAAVMDENLIPVGWMADD